MVSIALSGARAGADDAADCGQGVGWMSDMNAPSCTEAGAVAGTCGIPTARENTFIRKAIEAIRDCDPARAVLREAHSRGHIRFSEFLIRPPMSMAIAATHDLTIIVVSRYNLDLNHWRLPDLTKILRHEAGHLIYPTGQTVNGIAYDTEEMARSHGSCFSQPQKAAPEIRK